MFLNKASEESSSNLELALHVCAVALLTGLAFFFASQG